MSFSEEIEISLRARVPLIVVRTVEEARAIDVIVESCNSSGRRCMQWDLARGFLSSSGQRSESGKDPITALEFIRGNSSEKTLFVLRDFHEFWKDPMVKRQLRNAAQELRMTPSSIMVVTPSAELPQELADEAVLLDLAPPDADELEGELNKLAKDPNVKVSLTDLGRRKLVQAAAGMTRAQASRVFSRAIVTGGGLDDEDIDLVNEAKKAIIRESEALEFYPTRETLDDIGGLEALKHWLNLRERAWTKEASDYGLPAPKGIALIGIPGTGKSLTAKMIGGLWRLPLLRLDVGALFGSLVGESEERVRQALRLTEAMAPCVLWIDEIEKSFSAMGSDGGTSQRVFGTVLTWMQDKNEAVFVVATANDISRLPPELLRRGRFDEVFFLDLPTESERREIFAVHLEKRRRPAQQFDVGRLADQSAGYVGAEIEQCIIDAMYVAFNESPSRDVTTEDIAQAIKRMVPLSKSQKEVVEALRQWLAEGRAQSASFEEPARAEREFVPLEL